MIIVEKSEYSISITGMQDTLNKEKILFVPVYPR